MKICWKNQYCHRTFSFPHFEFLLPGVVSVFSISSVKKSIEIPSEWPIQVIILKVCGLFSYLIYYLEINDSKKGLKFASILIKLNTVNEPFSDVSPVLDIQNTKCTQC